jgi:sterol desaturase/sphingolipid hydroxylase (fatty acid hydroxylase superfamily)
MTIYRSAAIIMAMAALGWAGGVLMDVTDSLLTGEPFSLSELTAPSYGAREIFFAAIMGASLLLDWRARGRNGLRPPSLLNGAGYNLPFLLADLTGAMRAGSILFTFGLASLALTAISLIPYRLDLSHLPLAAQVALAFAIGTFIHYWTHRFMHTKSMWALHAIHHSDRDFGILTLNRRHPIEAFVFDLAILPSLTVLGFDVMAVLITRVLVVLVNALQHSHLPFPLWAEKWIVIGPAAHRVHHAIDADYHDLNFGALTIWDRLFGTFVLPSEARMIVTGIDDPRYDTGRPFRELFDSARIWVSGLLAVFASREAEEVISKESGSTP